MDAKFMQALVLILKNEGGYVNNPADPGGATNKGIIQSVYDTYLKSKGQAPKDVKFIYDAEVQEIYYNNYWRAAKCDKLLPKIAVVHFDAAVNCGVGQAAKFLQRALGVKDDGVIGSMTLAKLSMYTDNETEITQKYLDERKKFYNDLVAKKPTLKVFLKGWLNRLDKVKAFIS